MAGIRLMSTDFDGTLIGYPSDGKCSQAFGRALVAHKAGGGYWAVNTGRGLDHAIEGIEQFDPPHLPDFLLTNEREVYRLTEEKDWEEFGDWNQRCRSRHVDLFSRARHMIKHVEDLASQSEHITMIYEAGQPVGLVTTSEEVMHEVAVCIDLAREDFPDFHYQRNFVYLRFCHRDYHKGSALAELCRLLEIPRDAVFAAGDHYNDLSMLDGTFAAMPGCPLNAIEPVKQAVRRAGGYVAGMPFADGTAEAYLYFLAKENGRPVGLGAR